MQVKLSSAPLTSCPWDAESLTITVPAGLGVAGTTEAVRAALMELNTPQPPEGAVCSCGESVDIPAVIRRGPARTNEAVTHGA